MKKIETSGMYSNGYDQVFFRAGHELTDVVFDTFQLVKATETPAKTVADAAGAANPGYSEMVKRTEAAIAKNGPETGVVSAASLSGTGATESTTGTGVLTEEQRAAKAASENRKTQAAENRAV